LNNCFFQLVSTVNSSISLIYRSNYLHLDKLNQMPKYTDDESTKKNSFLVILATGLLAGTLDAIAAIVNYTINGGKLPSKIFQYIASGAVGPQAFTGGAGMIILGIVLHYTIAMSFTLFFFLIFPGI